MKRLYVVIATAGAACAAAANATTVNWTFQGTYSGSGQITYNDTTDVLTALSGSYNNQALSLVTLSADPNNPFAQIGDNHDGTSTYRAVPNTGGANYQFDDLFHQTSSTYGILASTGTGANETVFVLGYDGPDYVFFNIVTTPTYQYVEDRGRFTTSAAAVPESASWAMFIGGFGLVGGAMRRRRTNIRFA